MNYYRANKLAIRWEYKTCMFSLFLFLLLPATEASSSWLLWQHWVEYRNPLPLQKDEKGKIKGFRKYRDTWSLKNAFDTRDKCIRRLGLEPEATRSRWKRLEQNVPPEKRTKFTSYPSRVDIHREVYMSSEIQPGGKRQRATDYINFWCLPAVVDPKTIGDR